jgi:hypothetical protein
MIDPTRLSTIKVKDLTLANLYDKVLAFDGREHHAGQLLGWDREGRYWNLLLGPTEYLRKFLVADNSDIQILDNEKMRSPVAHWGV